MEQVQVRCGTRVLGYYIAAPRYRGTELQVLSEFCRLNYMLIMFALFDMSELCKNRDLIGILIACLIDVAARKIDEGLKCQRFLDPRALSCEKL